MLQNLFGRPTDHAPESNTAGDKLEQELNTSAATARLIAQFHKLDASEQQVLRLCVLQGLDHAEASHALGCTKRGVAVRLHRATQRLQALLGADNAHPPVVNTLYAKLRQIRPNLST